MSLRTNLVISVVFAALLAFVYFHEIKGSQERELVATRARQLADFSDHEAQRLTIAHPESTVVVVREGQDWVITQPVRTRADNEAIERFLRSMKETEIEGEPVQDSASVAAGEAALAPYGLASPRLSVHLGLAASAAQRLDTLHFGIDTPTQRFTYVQRSGENPEIRTVRAWRYDNLDKGLFDLRDRHVLHFKRDDVVELRVEPGAHPGEAWRASRRDGAWVITSPLETAADDKAFTQILTRLENARIESFDHEQPTAADLDHAGLTPGEEYLQFTLITKVDDQEPSAQKLRLGQRQVSGDHYAMDDQRVPVYTLDSNIVSQLTRSISDLRDRHPFQISTASVTGIDMTVAEQTLFRAVRDSSGGWQLASHEQRQAKAWRLNDLLAAVSALEVEDFVADASDVLALDVVKFGFARPQVRLALHREGDETLFIEVAAKGEHTYARRTDVASVFEVPADALSDLSPTLDDVALPMTDGPDSAASSTDPGSGSSVQ